MKRKIKLIGVYDYTVILTYSSLFAAVAGLLWAVEGRFSLSVLCLMASGICDAFDGIVARSKKDRTGDEKAFGIQLDSLCDVVSFGFYPACLCWLLGMDGIAGLAVACTYCLCAVARLAFFNVLEGKRQQQESGCAKSYRGLPVTTVSMLLPPVYLLRPVMGAEAFALLLYPLMLLVAFLFVLDFSVPKPDWKKILTGK